MLPLALSSGHEIGLAVVAACFIAFALASSFLFPRFRVQFPGRGLPAFIVVTFVFFFGMSWGPVVWVMLGEKFPNRIRAAALSVAASAQWLANWVITTTFPSLKGASLGLAYGIYAGFAVLSFIFVRWVITETNGRELEAMPEQVEVRAGAKPVRGRPRFDEA